MCKQVFLFVLLFESLFTFKCDIVNTKVVRMIDVQSQLVKIDLAIYIQNWGLRYVDQFLYSLDPDIQKFYIKFKNEQGKELFFDKTIGKCGANHILCYNFRVSLYKPLAPNSASKIKVELVYVDKIVPVYKTRTFKDDHIVAYTGNLLFYSPYKTLSLETTYMWGEIVDLQVTHPPHYQNKHSVNYSHKSVAPFSFDKIKMEYRNNDPFFVISELERVIDVSHFGKIVIEDRVAIKNEGSKLVGPYEHKLSDMELRASKWLYTHLPASAENVQFFDTIGNSSKSTLLHFRNLVTFKFRPRYPLLSGWKTFYVVKYSVPAFEYLYHDSKGKFVLKIRIVDHILNDALIRSSSTKVLLPEAARIVRVDVPYGFDRLANEKLYTGLCTFGRSAVVLNGSDIVENHITDVTVEYLFPPIYLLRAPFALVLYLEGVFICFILISRAKTL